MNWLRLRCSRDNFWNLMFWLGMTASSGVVDVLKNIAPFLTIIVFLVIFTVMPYLLAKVNKVTYTKDKIFVNKQGEPLNNRYPTAFPLVIFCSIMLSSQLFFVIIKYPLIKESIMPYTASVLIFPTLYFILKNCPISILFNKNAWCPEITGTGGGTYHVSPSSSSSVSGYSSLSPGSWSTDPCYKHLSGNIHHR